MIDDQYKSFDDIIKDCAVYGVDVTWRTLNYYKSIGLLPKAERREKDKRGFYHYHTVLVLLVYNFLQNHLGFTLQEIKKIADKVHPKPKSKTDKIVGFAIFINASYNVYLHNIGKVTDKIGGIIGGVSEITRLNSFYRAELVKTKAISLDGSAAQQGAKWAESTIGRVTK